jgi:hypothetical protein
VTKPFDHLSGEIAVTLTPASGLPSRTSVKLLAPAAVAFLAPGIEHAVVDHAHVAGGHSDLDIAGLAHLRGGGCGHQLGCLQLLELWVAAFGQRIARLAQIDARRAGAVTLDPHFMRLRHCGQAGDRQQRTSPFQHSLSPQKRKPTVPMTLRGAPMKQSPRARQDA